MKLTAEKLFEFYNSVDNARNIKYDDNGHIIAFDYIKYYGTSKRSSKIIKVSLKSSKEAKKAAAVYLEEKPFFNQLADNIDRVTDVKLHCEKIYKYTLDGQKYKTDKTDTKKLFDFLPYKDFLKITRQRFWNNDGLLRNGYFSGLIGTNDYNIERYKNNPYDYKLYDVDFNAAYPYCLKMPLPYDRFYTLQEWEKVKGKFLTSMKFYHIKIKSIKNVFGIYIPPQPYIEYKDFDFLLQKSNSNMIVSAERLELINKVYGKESYIIKNTYVCPTKIYVKLAKFAQELYDKIQKAKNDNNEELTNSLKIALNSLIGNFGRRDEARSIKGLKLVDSDILKDVISVQWNEPEDKQQQNYLPLAMVVNDITARRLFNLMTDENVLRLCYNTDGGIIALKKGYRIVTSEKIGRLKAKQIYEPHFFHTTLLYARPLIYDVITNKCYNTKSVYYDGKNFIYNEILRVNTRNGFIKYKNTYPIVVEEYKKFNLRQSEIIMKLSNNDLYKKLKKVGRSMLENEILKDAARDLEKICNPYDELYNEIRHKPKNEITEYKQIAFKEKFFKQIS